MIDEKICTFERDLDTHLHLESCPFSARGNPLAKQREEMNLRKFTCSDTCMSIAIFTTLRLSSECVKTNSV